MTCCTLKKTREEFIQQAKIHKALANEARLMIVDRIQSCECTVGELAQAVKLDMSTVSKHLSVLLNVGIVDRRKDGNQVHYRLLTPCVLEMVACTTKVINGDTL